MHYLPQLFQQAGLDPVALQSQPLHIGASCLVLLLPGAVAAALHASGAWTASVQQAPAAAAEAGETPGAVSEAAALAFSAGFGDSLRALRGSGPASGGNGSGRPAEGLGRSQAPMKPLPPFLELAYGYMPLVWGATLAHHLPLLLTEVGRILPVRLGSEAGYSDTKAWNPDHVSQACQWMDICI